MFTEALFRAFRSWKQVENQPMNSLFTQKNIFLFSREKGMAC